ncbi:hypothetical protein Tco_0507462 [Tanacetum coccineum]
MENEQELSNETLTRVYLGSYEHYKGVVAAKDCCYSTYEEFMVLFIVEMRLEAKVCYVTRRGHVGGLEDDKERLEDVLYKLESSFDVLVTPCEAADKERRKEDDIDPGSDELLRFTVASWVMGRLPCLLLRYCGSSWLDVLFVACWTLTGFAYPVVMYGASFTQRDGYQLYLGCGSIISEGLLSSICWCVGNHGLWLFLLLLFGQLVVIAMVGVFIIPVFLLVLSVFAIDAACAFRAEEMPSLISYRMAAKVMAGVSNVDVLLGGILSTKDNTDGVKIAGGVIGSSDKIEFSEELKDLLPSEAEK